MRGYIDTSGQDENIAARTILWGDERMVAQKKRPKSRSSRLLRTSVFLLAAFFAASYLTGCAHFNDWLHNGFKVGPNYQRPAAPVADAWIDYDGDHLIHESVDHSHWWTVFNDPQLDLLIHSVYEQNLTLRQAGMRVLEARAQRGIAAGNILPQQQGVTMDFRRVNVALDGNNLGVIPDSFHFDLWQLGGKIGWELDIWGKFRRAIEAADAELDASVEDYDAMLVCLLADTAIVYVETRLLQERIEIAKKNVDLQQEQVDIMEKKVNEGDESPEELTRIQSLLHDTQARIPFLEKDLCEKSKQLCVLLGIPTRDLVQELGKADVPTAPEQVAAGIPAELLRRRPDIRRAERLVAAQSAEIGVAASELFPQFSLAGNISYSGSKFRDMFDATNLNGAVGPSVQWKILHYGRLVNNIRVQDARFQQLALEYQQAVVRANAEVQEALCKFAKSQDETRLLKQSVDKTEMTRKAVAKQVEEGEKEQFILVEVLKEKVRREDNLAVARAQIPIQLILVYKGLGGGWQIRKQDHGEVLVGHEMIAPEPIPAGETDDAERLPEPAELDLQQPATLPDVAVPMDDF